MSALAACCVALLTPKAGLRAYADARVTEGEWSAKTAASRVSEEFGRTCANLGILTAMATIIGEAMLLSGAAEAIAAASWRFRRRMRPKRLRSANCRHCACR